ncbi:MAG: cytochrome d ubiquinol oxidase subunit II [Calditrichaeota bacterium]|nr:MAG: cytochrome d ubiquinol oxidase subunit II [Calditrichota bacterium]
MEIFWSIVLVFMLTMFILLDGADMGAGIIHLFVAKNEDEKQRIIRAIGPFWDGNEVWLIAAGGVMFFAFPTLYASAFSGFYLPLIMVLWLLIFRAIGLEFRNLVANNLWKTAWDKAFGWASLLLTVFLGAALGNVVRGVNLGMVANGEAQHEAIYFFNPLWNDNFSPLNDHPGILDWFTVILSLVAAVTLTIHGAHWIIFKTQSSLNQRLKKLVVRLNGVLALLVILSLFAWLVVRPDALDNYYQHPWLWIFPLLMLLALGVMFRVPALKKDWQPFAVSSLFIISAFGSTAGALFPNLLPSRNNHFPSLTIYNASADAYGLEVGLIWWLIALVLVAAYFFYVHKIFAGKMDDVEYH